MKQEFTNDSSIKTRTSGLASTKITNELALAINAMNGFKQGQIDRPNPLGGIWFLGTVTDEGPASEDDYTDERYWIKPAYIDSDSDPAAVADLKDDPIIASPATITATNIAEALAHTHTLPKDSQVLIWGTIDVAGVQRFILVGPRGDLQVKVTSNASGGGKYNGTILIPPTSDVSASGNLAESDLGTTSGGTACLILNRLEIGASTHDIDLSATPVVFAGSLVRINDDGKPVIAIAALQQGGNCDDE